MDYRVQAVPYLNGAGLNYLAALVHLRHNWHRLSCTIGDWACELRAATAPTDRTHQSHHGAGGTRGDDSNYYFAATAALGHRDAGRLAVSNFVMGRGPLPANFRCDGRIYGFPYDRFGDNLGHRSFRRHASSNGDRVLQAQTVILVVATFALVLAALFAERRANEARLARSNEILQHERNSKLVNLEPIIASIAHEVGQPLTAILTNANAGRRFLDHSRPNIEKGRSAFDSIVSAGRRFSEIFDNIRTLFKTSHQEKQVIDMNEIVLGTLSMLQAELKEHGVTTHTELASELPRIMGHRGQLREVVLNLRRNAIEAMEAIDSVNRVLQVKTQHLDREAIAVAVEDSGPGIDSEKLEGIFDAGFTTKPKGTGLGLAICRMIIERHGGQLSARSDKKRSSTLFQFILPISPPEDSSGAAL